MFCPVCCSLNQSDRENEVLWKTKIYYRFIPEGESDQATGVFRVAEKWELSLSSCVVGEGFGAVPYPPLVSDWQNYESWELAGAKTAEERATAVWQSTLEQYEQPELDGAIAERLDAYVAERRVALLHADI